MTGRSMTPKMCGVCNSEAEYNIYFHTSCITSPVRWFTYKVLVVLLNYLKLSAMCNLMLILCKCEISSLFSFIASVYRIHLDSNRFQIIWVVNLMAQTKINLLQQHLPRHFGFTYVYPLSRVKY